MAVFKALMFALTIFTLGLLVVAIYDAAPSPGKVVGAVFNEMDRANAWVERDFRGGEYFDRIGGTYKPRQASTTPSAQPAAKAKTSTVKAKPAPRNQSTGRSRPANVHQAPSPIEAAL